MGPGRLAGRFTESVRAHQTMAVADAVRNQFGIVFPGESSGSL
jgi:hypothetical protein